MSRTLHFIRVVVVVLIVTILLLEIGLRGARWLRDGTLMAENSYDADIGWVPTPKYAPTPRQLVDFAGKSYERKYTANELGARLWGTTQGRPKILFLGDSFTQAAQVSDDATYYARFAQLSGLDTYAIGAGGYGTLHEKKLLKRVLKSTALKPDIFVLQFCGNDFADNGILLSRDLVVLSQQIRPYRLLDGSEAFTLGGGIFAQLLRWSATFRAAVNVTEGLLYKRYGGYGRGGLSPNELKRAQLDAVKVTRLLLAEMRGVLPGDSRSYAFSCSVEERQLGGTSTFVRLAREAGFEPLVGARRFVDEGPNGPSAVLAADGGHLNAEGSLRLAKFLHREICAREQCAQPGATEGKQH